jgi:small subunit ribosomal protein S10
MKFRIFLKSFNKEAINNTSKEFRAALKTKECEVVGLVALPTRIKKFCVLRSPQVNKDSREQFEVRIYKQFLDITAESPSILSYLLKLEVPSEVSCSLKILQNK